MLIFSHHFAQSASHTIACDGAADLAGRDKSRARLINILQYAQRNERPAEFAALVAHAGKFRGACQALRLRERKLQGQRTRMLASRIALAK
jgi:hypothetical protein